MSTTPYISVGEFNDLGIPAAAYAGLAPTVISSAILSASSLADSYLRKRYTLPISTPGDDLKAKVADLVQYNLLVVRGFRPDSGNDVIASKRRDDAENWFRDVAKGLVEPDIVDATEIDEEGPLAYSEPAQNFSIQTRGRSRTCGED